MTLNAVLEIVLSLVALFWLLAAIASFLVEAVNSLLLNLRGAALERFVGEMVLGADRLSGVYRGHTRSLAGTARGDPLGVMSHALLASLRKPGLRASGPGTAPSYIPASAFARALLDRLTNLAAAGQLSRTAQQVLDRAVLGSGGRLAEIWPAKSTARKGVDGNAYGRLATLFAHLEALPAGQALELLRSLRGQVTTQNGAASASRINLLRLLDGTEQALSQLITESGRHADTPIGSLLEPGALWLLAARMSGIAPGGNVDPIDAVRSVVLHAPLPRALREALLPIVEQSNFDLEQVRHGIENWFDSVMERASGWYKRHTTLWLGLAGLVMAAALNINPVWIVRDLAVDPRLRSAGVEFASHAASSREASLAQQVVFARAADARSWDAVANRAQEEATRQQWDAAYRSLRGLAVELQPLLLRSGDLVGPMLDVAVPATNAGTEWSQAKFDDWSSRLCRPGMQSGAGGSGSACRRNLRERIARAGDDNPRYFEHEVAGAFWTTDAFVWSPALGSAVWSALAAVERCRRDERGEARTCSDPEAAMRRITALQSAIKEARELSTRQTELATNFFDRVPSIGWRARTEVPAADADAAKRRRAIEAAAALFGWGLTALMVSFGAPFWFDLMSRLMQRRVTGPKPESSAA
ncbi:MAG: hypothetical protein KF683_12170 [Rubrivivax sp.]|nr:hypothetical protein [Rubrivivax sp.]